MINIDPEARRIVFQGEYRQTSGPLPTMRYPLIGYWEYEGVPIKALFEASAIPVHEGVPILYRYEDTHVSHAGQAKYDYFTIPGYAGMILSQAGKSQVGLPIAEVFQHLTEEANQRKLEAWRASKTPEALEEHTVVEVPDRLGNYPPAILILSVGPTSENV